MDGADEFDDFTSKTTESRESNFLKSKPNQGGSINSLVSREAPAKTLSQSTDDQTIHKLKTTVRSPADERASASASAINTRKTKTL